MVKSNLAFNHIRALVALTAVALIAGFTQVHAQESFSNLTLKKTYLRADPQIVYLDATPQGAFEPVTISCPGTGTADCVAHAQFSGLFQEVTQLFVHVYVDSVLDPGAVLYAQPTSAFETQTWSVVTGNLAPGPHTIEVTVTGTAGGHMRYRTLRVDVLK